MNKKTVKDVELNGKKVLVRVDFNVPMKDGKITNDNRIVAALPTIKYILENGGRAILFSHLGKIKSEEDKASKSLRPAAERLAELLGQDVKFIPETRGAELEAAIAELKDAQGRPLLMASYNGAPFDEGSLLLGRPVIINDNVASLNEVGKSIFFGDIQRSYLVAPRKSFTIKTSSEYGFINDSQATKVNVRLDAKKTLEEAMVYFTSKAAMLTAKTTKTK